MRGRCGSPRSLLCHLALPAPARHGRERPGSWSSGIPLAMWISCLETASRKPLGSVAPPDTDGRPAISSSKASNSRWRALACVGVAGRPGHFDERASSTRRIKSRRPPCAGVSRRCHMGPGRQAQNAEKPSSPAASTCLLSSNVLRCRQSSIRSPADINSGTPSPALSGATLATAGEFAADGGLIQRC